ncbi:hypothetical protein [Halobaculum lipolyticum]|uniref:DUF5658 domain-containing protein n=1 Tax=Halobaculum lipolyticum TaxID=3032001 RepID=A0ABD5WD45_9EURY|nr:hypothetical protein [Halobaculum sp. DT31]
MEWSDLSLETTPFDEREFTQLWLLATALYGVGDVVTTIALIEYVPEIDEGNLLMATAVEQFGLLGLVGLKVVVFMLCIWVSLWGARDGDAVVYYLSPALLAVAGAFTTVYNLWLLFGVT